MPENTTTVYKSVIKPLLFLLSPEKAHHFTLSILKFVLAIPIVGMLFRSHYTVKDKRLERKVMGLTFPNPVGLAAGFDKDGKHYHAMSALGFGFLEIGTVTPIAQEGNPQPRLFRLPNDNGLINRMGFNNEGLDAMVERLSKPQPKGVIIGGNIGKNKLTPNADAVSDYEKSFEALFDCVDYFVVNVSSPNTPGLRELQNRKPLTKLLSRLQELNHAKTSPKPILLKIAPDMNNEQLDDVISIVEETKLEGIIATNTTISRSGLNTSDKALNDIGNGGLSGLPLKQRSTEVIRYISEKTQGRMTIIGVGGINSKEDALEKLEAGAALVQIYSGLVYEGPSLIKQINQSILKS